MAGGLSRYGHNLILDLLFGGDASKPATLYIGVVTAEPTITDTGSTLSEPVGGAYARVGVSNTGTNWPLSSSAQQKSGTSITFPTATADWGTLSYFVICDASSGGNLIGWGRLSPTVAVTSGQTLYFAAGSLVFTAANA